MIYDEKFEAMPRQALESLQLKREKVLFKSGGNETAFICWFFF